MFARYGVGFEYDVGKRDKWHLRGDVTNTKVDPTGDPINTIPPGDSDVDGARLMQLRVERLVLKPLT